MANPASMPASLAGQVYPNTPTPVFPEQSNPRYNASEKLIGLCFSGGGGRAMSAAMGQMRGIMAMNGVIDTIGAISCVSGGCWFGSLYTYAPTSIDDETLLGPVVQPGDLTVTYLQNISSQCECYPLTSMSNSIVTAIVAVLEYEHIYHGLPYDKFWSRFLNSIMFMPFNLSGTTTFLSLDTSTVRDILLKNPELTSSNFYVMRPDRPFFIGNGTQIYPYGDKFIMRHVEYNAMYSGTAQEFPGIGPAGQDFGYGYCDNLIFNTLTPTTPDSSNFVSGGLPTYPFILSDAVGSSSAALGAACEELFKSSVIFPSFNYWPMTKIGKESAASYGFEDGGNLENVGIVPILRRQYPIVVAFVNSSYPIGTKNENCKKGVDGQISRLFGIIPKPKHKPYPPGFNDQDTQVFNNDNNEFDNLAAGLARAKANGEAVIYSDFYTIKENNAFGISQYPDSTGNQVAVVWVYNDINGEWKNKLSDDVQALLTSTDPTNYMANFPNYKTVGQNKDKLGLPELLWFSPQQVNLLANMHCYTVMSMEEELDKVLSRVKKG